MIGPLIKERRQRKGITQTDLARRTGLSQNYISKLEGGSIELPQRATLEVLGAALDITLAEFYRAAGVLELADEEPPQTLMLPTNGAMEAIDVDAAVAYVESKPDQRHQDRLARWRKVMSRADYERVCTKIYVAWSSNADLLLSGLEILGGPGE